MVCRLNLSAYDGTPPATDQGSRQISDGPLYDVQQVLAVLDQGEEALRYWTRKCIADVQRFGMSPEDVAELIKIALRSGRFKGSSWCENKPGGSWAACDSYQLSFTQWLEAAHKYIDVEYYIKFAVGRTGKVLLMVSCHPPEER